MRSCYIFDIDGTLANNKHRVHHLEKTPKDWDAYHADYEKDVPFDHMCRTAHMIAGHYTVIFCTGRPEYQRRGTLKWLYHNVTANLEKCLYMRKDGDHRPDHIVKLELLEQIRLDGLDPIMAFDDRNSVVKMWRDAGIPCAQVAEGDF